jgi:hypothetical protein
MQLERNESIEVIQWTGDNYPEVAAFLAEDESFNGTHFLRGPEGVELVIDNNNVGVSDFTVSVGSWIGVRNGSARHYTETELVDEWGYEPQVEDDEPEPVAVEQQPTN